MKTTNLTSVAIANVTKEFCFLTAHYPFICVRVFELSNRIESFVGCTGVFAEKYSLSNNQGKL